MDRSFKKRDLVHVYQDSPDGECLGTFHQAPYSYAGFDYYRYTNQTYPGYERLSDMHVYILLKDVPIRQTI